MSRPRDHALHVALLRRSEPWKKQPPARGAWLAGGDDLADAAQMANDYRLLAHDLARARRLMPDSRTREYLEAAYAHAHATSAPASLAPRPRAVGLFRDEIPEVVSWLRPHIIWATLSSY